MIHISDKELIFRIYKIMYNSIRKQTPFLKMYKRTDTSRKKDMAPIST